MIWGPGDMICVLSGASAGRHRAFGVYDVDVQMEVGGLQAGGRVVMRDGRETVRACVQSKNNMRVARAPRVQAC